MSDWGLAFCRQVLDSSVNAAVDGAKYVGGKVVDGAIATVDGAKYVGGKAVDGAKYVGGKVVDGAIATVDGAKYVGGKVVDGAKYAGGEAVDGAKYVAAVGVLGGTTVGVVGVAGAGAAGYGINKVVGAATEVKEYLSPTKPSIIPNMECSIVQGESKSARAARINKRNQLIDQAKETGDPAAIAKANQLKDDMQAVEMARLSANAYDQYSPQDPPNPLPKPWKAISTKEEAEAAGLNWDYIQKSKAVIYQLPPDFPMEPKTVVAFRGTTGEQEDILTDHDQGLGLKTEQYDAARALGEQVGDVFPDAQVTGHSLGGGKAQAAGIAGKLKGRMYNSAGIHPNSVDPYQPENFADSFIQHRAEGGMSSGFGDPLTGVQNSFAAQQAAYGMTTGLSKLGNIDAWALKQLGIDYHDLLPKGTITELTDRVLNVTPSEAKKNYEFSEGKWYLPPAVGEVSGVASKTADGYDSSVASQHSVVNMVNGFESRKLENVQSMLLSTGSTENASAYFGPMPGGKS